tara:strand:- start:270 stop:854 length:585 start_codon:yes stop_codon:yes gene_type:complete
MTAQLANGGHKIYPKIIFDNKQDTIENIKEKMKFAEIKNDEDLKLLTATEKLFSKDEKNYEALYRNKENVKFVLDAMFRSTNEVYGTSFSSRIEDPKYQFAGKTGTAQVKRITEAERELDLKTNQIPYKERDHAWYIAFGPYKNPRYAVSILIEHGGSGSSAAAPIAKKLFKFIIDRHELREKNRKKYLINNNV